MELKAHARSKSPNLKTSPSIHWVKRSEVVNCMIAAAKRKNEKGLGRVGFMTRPDSNLSLFFLPSTSMALFNIALRFTHWTPGTGHPIDSRRTKHGRIQQNNNCEAARSDKIIQVSLNNTYFYTCPSQTVLVVDTLTLRYSQQLRQLFKQQNVLTSLSSLILLAKSSSFSVS